MIISVAMAVFNGEKYIEGQLQSILNQTVKPDEIVISDDGSKDGTLDLVHSFVEDNPNLAIIILTDNKKHGFCQNFQHAIENCSGDVIILSDQDDVWHPEKVERTISFYETHPDALLMFHDADTIDEKGQPRSGKIDSVAKNLISIRYGKSDLVKLARDDFLPVVSTQILVHGMVISFRNELLKIAFPFPSGLISHDFWLFFCAIAADRCWYIDENLVSYRRHGENLTKNAPINEGFQYWLMMIGIEGVFLPIYGNYIDSCEKKVMELTGCTDNVIYRNIIFKELEGRIIYKAHVSSTVDGIRMLKKLYANNSVYRKKGKKRLYTDCLRIILHGKRKRKQVIDGFIDILDSGEIGNRTPKILRPASVG